MNVSRSRGETKMTTDKMIADPTRCPYCNGLNWWVAEVFLADKPLLDHSTCVIDAGEEVKE